MTKLTKALCATLLLAAPLPAFAQGMPVHDSANLLQQINAVRQAIQVVAQGKQQIAEAQKLYQDFNKLTDIPALAQQLKSDALRELDTSGGSRHHPDCQGERLDIDQGGRRRQVQKSGVSRCRRAGASGREL